MEYKAASRAGHARKRWHQVSLLLVVFLIGSHLLSAYTSYADANGNRRVVDLRAFELAANQAFTSLVVAESSQRGFVITGTPALRADVAPAVATAEDRLDDCWTLSRKDPVLRARLTPLRSAFAAKIEWMKRVIAEADRDGRSRAVELARTGRGKALMDNVQRQLQALNSDASRILSEENARASRYAKIDIAASALFVLLGGLLSYVFYRLGENLESSEREIERLHAERTANLEKEVNRRTAQLQLANGDLETFSSLTARFVLNELDELSKSLPEDPAARSTVGRLRQTLGSVLQLSKLSRERTPLADLDLAQALRTVLQAMQEEQPLSNLTIVIPDRVPAVANERAVRILFRALADSAWPHLRETSNPSIDLNVDEVEGRTVYAFRYSGNGSKPINLEDLFEHVETKEDRHLSIALGIAQRVVRRHGGHIWADSLPDHRTSIYFTLTP